MIDTNSFKGLLDKYGMDADSVIKNNSKVLIRGNYSDIEATINYLVNDLGFASRYIEKAPSILYFNVSAIRKNVEFLKRQGIIFSNVEKCLHVLSTIPWRLEETYNYVRDNYGDQFINRNVSILSIDTERIKEIEKLGLDKRLVLSAALTFLPVSEIKKIVEICRKNNVEITGSVFRKSSVDIEKIISTCRQNNIEITGTVFMRSAEEIEDIISICKRYNVGITSSVFNKTAKDLEQIIKICRELEPTNKKEYYEILFNLPDNYSNDDLKKAMYKYFKYKIETINDNSLKNKLTDDALDGYNYLSKKLSKKYNT